MSLAQEQTYHHLSRWNLMNKSPVFTLKCQSRTQTELEEKKFLRKLHSISFKLTSSLYCYSTATLNFKAPICKKKWFWVSQLVKCRHFAILGEIGRHHKATQFKNKLWRVSVSNFYIRVCFKHPTRACRHNKAEREHGEVFLWFLCPTFTLLHLFFIISYDVKDGEGISILIPRHSFLPLCFIGYNLSYLGYWVGQN